MWPTDRAPLRLETPRDEILRRIGFFLLGEVGYEELLT
jgi:hypothetical protein